MPDQAMLEDSVKLLKISGGEPFILTDDERDNICEMLDTVLTDLEDEDIVDLTLKYLFEGDHHDE